EGVRIGEGTRALLDEWLHMLGEEPVGLLPRLPHVEDPEHARLVVETGRMRDQPVEGSLTDLLGDEVIVRGGAIPDRELLDVGDCHRFLLWTVFVDPTSAAQVPASLFGNVPELGLEV